jgi:hypothetical protein
MRRDACSEKVCHGGELEVLAALMHLAPRLTAASMNPPRIPRSLCAAADKRNISPE